MPKTKTAKLYFDSRSKVPLEDQWKLQKMYSSQASWAKDFQKISALIPPLSKFRGTLKNPTNILRYFQAAAGVKIKIEKLYVYASHGSSVDLSNHQLQILTQKSQNLYIEFSQTVSFQGPELSKLPDAVLKKMINDAKFREFHRELRSVLAKKKHILSDPEEALLSQAGKMFSGPNDIFSALDDVDLTFADTPNAQGKMVKLTNGNYQTFLESPKRQVRAKAFQTFYQSYQSHLHTFAQTLNLEIKQHQFYAQVKKYKSCLEAALSTNLIDPKVYQTLLQETHASLPVLYKYFVLRAKKLKLKKLQMYDLRVNIMDSQPLKFSYDEAVQLCLDAVKPLGEDYVKVLANGLKNGWVDKYENKGKRGGAFSGGCYDSDPYILMNFTGSLNDVYTLIHEGGHSMHSYLARQNQPFGLADYSLFAAEIASTVNERLLTAHLLKKYSAAGSQTERQNILAYEIDAIRATYFRQTMFAEFELLIHQSLEKGEPLTAQFFNQEYARLNKLYYGPSVAEDPYIQYEWARIPHFYYNFYVYQYATGIAAAYYFSDQILNPKTASTATKKYLDFLKSGGNHFPLVQLKRAGLDFTKPDLYRAVAKNLQKCLNLL